MSTGSVPVSKQQVAVKWGIILAIISVIYSFVLQFSGQITNQALTWVGYVFVIVILVLAIREYKTANGGFMRFGEGLTVGLFTSVVSSVISSIFTYVYIKFIDDSMLTTIKQAAMNEMAKNPNLSAEQMDAAMNNPMMDFFMSPEWILIGGLFGGIIGGLLISLVISAIMKKENPEEF